MLDAILGGLWVPLVFLGAGVAVEVRRLVRRGRRRPDAAGG